MSGRYLAVITASAGLTVQLLAAQAGAAAQTIAPPSIAAGSQVFAPAVGRGVVTIAPALIASGSSVLGPVVAVGGGATIAPALIAAGSAVLSPVVTRGAVTVSPPLIASGSLVLAPMLAPGAVILAPALIAAGSVVLAPVVAVANPALPNYRAALAAAKAGTAGPLIINALGDSTIAGSGAGTGTPATLIANNARSGAISQQLAAAFAASGLSINGADVCGFNFPANTQTVADYAAWNTSVTPGSWGQNTSGTLISLGGNMWNSQAAGANWSWTAEGRPFDRLTVYYLEFAGGGTFRIKIDGATATSTTGVSLINCVNATASIKKMIYTPAVGTHTVEMEWASGSIYVIDLDTIDTTNKASVHIRNLGQGSAKSADIIDNSSNWRQRFMLATLEAAHLHIIEGGQINDWAGGVAPATTAGNFTTMITAATTNGGDVLLLGPTRQSTSLTAAATQQATVDAVAALANGTTKVFYDLKTGVGDYSTMNGLGRMFDQSHPNRTGYAAEAAAVYGAISP